MTDINLPASGPAENRYENPEEEVKDFHIVTFNLGEEYGVPISQVQEIVRVGSITMVPNSPPYMEGVINLRGRVLPVLNLRKRLHLSSTEMSTASRIMVIEVGDKVIGLLVDSVSQVIKVPSSSVETAPEEVMEVDTDFIRGVAKLENRLVILIDLEKLLKKEKFEIEEATTHIEEI